MQSQAYANLPVGAETAVASRLVERHRALLIRLAVAGVFLAAGAVYATGGGGEYALMLALAAGFGGYMAINIGANDVANNIGPTVGARVMPIGAALCMAAVCEAAGAIIAGGAVVGTIRSGIISPALIPTTDAYIWALLGALLAAALWLNLATALGAAVSTAHVTGGAVLGAGVLREVLKARHARILTEIRANHPAGDSAAAEAFIARFHATPFGERKAMLSDLRARNRAGAPAAMDRADRQALARAHKRDIVNRGLMLRIFAAWVITVPATALISAAVFVTLRGILLP